MTQGLLSRSLPMLDLAISLLSTASDYMLSSPVVQSMYSKLMIGMSGSLCYSSPSDIHHHPYILYPRWSHYVIQVRLIYTITSNRYLLAPVALNILNHISHNWPMYILYSIHSTAIPQVYLPHVVIRLSYRPCIYSAFIILWA